LTDAALKAAVARHELNRVQNSGTKGWESVETYEERYRAALSALEASLEGVDGGEVQDAAALIVAERERQKRYRASTDALLELPQLFIAT